MKAKSKIQEIPIDIHEDLIALGLLQQRLREMVIAVETRQRRIVEKLTGAVKVDARLITDLIKQHNADAAKMAAKRGQR